MRRFFLTSMLIQAVLIPRAVPAAMILNCVEESSVQIGWDNKGAKMSAEINKPDKPAKLSLFVDEGKAFLKGNLGNEELTKIGRGKFLERTGSGNSVIWTVLEGSGKVPTFVFVQKAYELMGPYSLNLAYKCD